MMFSRASTPVQSGGNSKIFNQFVTFLLFKIFALYHLQYITSGILFNTKTVKSKILGAIYFEKFNLSQVQTAKF